MNSVCLISIHPKAERLKKKIIMFIQYVYHRSDFSFIDVSNQLVERTVDNSLRPVQ